MLASCLAPCCPLCHGREPFMTGLQSSPQTLLEGCSQEPELEAGIAELVRAHPGSASVVLRSRKYPMAWAWAGVCRPSLLSSPTGTVPDLHVKDPGAEAPRRPHPTLFWEVCHGAGGRQTSPVFSIVELCGECVRGFMFQCMLWAVRQ